MRITKNRAVSALGALAVLLMCSAVFGADDAAYERYIARGIAQLETNNYDSAVAEFTAALRERPHDFRALLYLGIAYSRSGSSETEPTLKKALLQNPKDPRVNLELGIYYFSKSIYAEAKDYFENTILLAPRTEFSSKAHEYLKVMSERGETKPWRLDLYLGTQYDTNVIVNGSASPLPQGISRESDWSAVGYLNARYRFFSHDKSEAFIGYNLYQNLHVHLSNFNVTQNIGELGAAFFLSPAVQVKALYAFEYVLVGGDEYDYANSFSPVLIISEGKGLSTSLEYRYTYTNYKNSELFFDNDDRTGSNNLFTITQYLPLHESVLAKIGYSFNDVNARKDYWSYTENKGFLGFSIALPYRISVNLEGSYYTQKYDADYPFEGVKRDDNNLTASVALSKLFSDRYGILLSQLYINNNSNIPDFDYNRAVTSIYFQMRF